MIPIAPHIEAFLHDYLSHQRGLSPHTCDSYAYCFLLLFEFAAKHHKVTPSGLMLEHLNASLIGDFLEHLENKRRNSPDTRNVRLAAIKSFYRFLEYREPAVLEQIRRTLAIPFKKTDTPLVAHLTQKEVQALLDAPNPTTRTGIRDRAMLHVAICAGLRVSELVGLQLDDVVLQQMNIRVHGKGRRDRAIPLWNVTATALRAWLAIRGTLSVPEVFVNARSEPMTRWGFAHVLKRNVENASSGCPSLTNKQVSPHVLRHTCAMIVLQATQDIRKVSLWLGHSNLETTEIYTRADPSDKLEMISGIVPPRLRKGTFRPPDKLLALLREKSYGEQTEPQSH
jgi:integrase/recombinase XerD